MPGMNGTGPMGQGAMTGRGMGVCQGYGLGKGIGQGLGCRRGIDRGMVRGVRFNGYNSLLRDDVTDQKALEQRQSFLEAQLKSIKAKLASFSQNDQE